MVCASHALKVGALRKEHESALALARTEAEANCEARLLSKRMTEIHRVGLAKDEESQAALQQQILVMAKAHALQLTHVTGEFEIKMAELQAEHEEASTKLRDQVASCVSVLRLFGVSSSFMEWYSAAEQGDSEAQYNLGLMYDYGEGVVQDYSAASAWYSKAAFQGHSEAQFNLGILFGNGHGVEQNDSEAAACYMEAAKQGHHEAQFNLGVLYYSGQGVKQSDATAAEWYYRSAVGGYADAQFNLGMMMMDDPEAEQNLTEAVEWLQKAADQGHTQASEVLDNLGDLS